MSGWEFLGVCSKLIQDGFCNCFTSFLNSQWSHWTWQNIFSLLPLKPGISLLGIWVIQHRVVCCWVQTRHLNLSKSLVILLYYVPQSKAYWSHSPDFSGFATITRWVANNPCQQSVTARTQALSNQNKQRSEVQVVDQIEMICLKTPQDCFSYFFFFFSLKKLMSGTFF